MSGYLETLSTTELKEYIAELEGKLDDTAIAGCSNDARDLSKAI